VNFVARSGTCSKCFVHKGFSSGTDLFDLWRACCCVYTASTCLKERYPIEHVTRRKRLVPAGSPVSSSSPARSNQSLSLSVSSTRKQLRVSDETLSLLCAYRPCRAAMASTNLKQSGGGGGYSTLSQDPGFEIQLLGITASSVCGIDTLPVRDPFGLDGGCARG
jgi:hypothetical protein